jgi:hypothetical protein
VLTKAGHVALVQVDTARGRALDLVARSLLNLRRSGFWERVPLLGDHLFRKRAMAVLRSWIPSN